MIEATDLTKRYGDKTAVDRLSFQVRPGRVTGFLGRVRKVASSARQGGARGVWCVQLQGGGASS